MRTTVTLDPDTRLLIERLMRERGITFREAVNTSIRAGAGSPVAEEGYTTPRSLGAPRVDVTRALALADELEDDELARRLAVGR